MASSLSKAPISWKKLNRATLARPWALEAPNRMDRKVDETKVVRFS